VHVGEPQILEVPPPPQTEGNVQSPQSNVPPQPSAIVPPWNDFAPAGFVAQFAPDGISLKWASYVMSSDLGFRLTDATIDVGVSALAVGPAGDIYIGGLTGPGFPVTPSAPVICFQGSTHRTNGFLAHLNSNGALLDATYLGNSAGGDIIFVGALLPLPGTASWSRRWSFKGAAIRKWWTPILSRCCSRNCRRAA